MGCWMRARTSTITTVENFLEQRVFKTGVANSIHYARRRNQKAAARKAAGGGDRDEDDEE
ncbi:hypothetical protein LguiB_024902 [Lonicera macranthoides]